MEFMPHAGTLPDSSAVIPFAERKYDILFSGTYYRSESYWSKIDQLFPKDSVMNRFYRMLGNRMLQDIEMTTEAAVLKTLEQSGLSIADEQKLTIFRCAESIDWMVRMHYREQVIQVLADAGFDLWLLGRGWENHPSYGLPNVHHINDRIPFAETLPFMADARINLNVMPWFKAGTYDRIFNILLQRSLPLTDSSAWIDSNFTDGVDIVLFDLKKLEQLPDITANLLADSDKVERIIENGYRKVAEKYTWKNCVDQIISGITGLESD